MAAEPRDGDGGVVERIRRLRQSGLPYYAIAGALKLSTTGVQRILQRGAPFRPRERDPDFTEVARSLGGGSSLRVEWRQYASICPKPYSFSHFAERMRLWQAFRRTSGSRGSPFTTPATELPWGVS